ncbi:chaplin [Streptomyces sp. XM4193]|uniref:chaplin n=1 Tax=Streptomyces sp. XM4193 TaxID=2929782 RepID=UPI001FFA3C4C|nr:chaplin [Streptomyces sp. XM4193]MCK1799101.1 chaplin [Streptomyces sp. XM4193]
MKHILKVGTMVAAGCALALGSAGGAVAHEGSGAGAQGVAAHSPGVLSGNVIQVPVSIPINLCGNSVNVIGALNPAFGNTCVNK